MMKAFLAEDEFINSAMGDGAVVKVVMGVMVIPSNRRNRDAVRATWGAAAAPRMLVRFVAGDVRCARSEMQAEQLQYGDCSFVDSKDCSKVHSPAKVYAWFNYAASTWPDVPWIGKMEDDGIVWPSALFIDLDALGPRAHLDAVYVGMMQWHGSCLMSEGSDAPGRQQLCKGCWGGWFSGGRPPSSNCPPLMERGMVLESTTGPLGSHSCPLLRFAPFACGPLDVRSRPLALAMAKCEYASRFFQEVSRRGERTRKLCYSADGAQGTAMSSCMSPLSIVDLGPGRQRFATARQLNNTNGVMIVHPIKTGILAEWNFMWNFLRRGPYRPERMSKARVSWRNDSMWPQVQRDALPRASQQCSHGRHKKSTTACATQ
ncbi:hypothetical protein AB1Y20_021249 [Prymnesium parvum]|uniref:Hexosyltransferase n=1 Tax=Prymnesium parvum TaxID=97485 RepID=A0AB34JL01_PRYPA